MTDFRHWPDVAGRAMGGSVIACNDELFAGSDNLINQGPAGYDPAAFGPRGKLYDGWETRRRREVPAGDAPSDWVIVRLGVPAVVQGVLIDTAFFTGNFPPFASVEGTTVLGYPSPEEVRAADWIPLLARSELEGDSVNAFPVFVHDRLITHVRLRIHPDGGVARFRVHGEVVADPRFLGGRIDLAAAAHGGLVVGCSNMFYASPANLIADGRAAVMSDGWETARRRDDGNDWVTVRLAAPGVLHDVVIDTSRFVGNAPGQAQLSDAVTGRELLARTRLQADTEHRFPLTGGPTASEVRLDIYPDGGLSRLRVHGQIDADAHAALAERWLGLLPPDVAASVSTTQFFH